MAKPRWSSIPSVKTANPSDYLRGSKIIGQKYTAWNTYNQGKPDFGKGSGPGTPYHEIQKTVKQSSPSRTWSPVSDPRMEAIRRRLGWS